VSEPAEMPAAETEVNGCSETVNGTTTTITTTEQSEAVINGCSDAMEVSADAEIKVRCISSLALYK